MELIRANEIYLPANNTAGSKRYVCDEDVLDEQGACMLQGKLPLKIACTDGFKYKSGAPKTLDNILMLSASDKASELGFEKGPAIEYNAMWVCQDTCSTIIESRSSSVDCSEPMDLNHFVNTYA